MNWMSTLSTFRLLAETLTAYLKRASETAGAALLQQSLRQEREAQKRIIDAITKYKNPNSYQRAYIDTLKRELQVYQAIRTSTLSRFTDTESS